MDAHRKSWTERVGDHIKERKIRNTGNGRESVNQEMVSICQYLDHNKKKYLL